MTFKVIAGANLTQTNKTTLTHFVDEGLSYASQTGTVVNEGKTVKCIYNVYPVEGEADQYHITQTVQYKETDVYLPNSHSIVKVKK